MAKTISDEVMKLSIEINGNKAQTELLDLEKKTRVLTEANKGHLLQKQLLEKQGKKDTEQYKLLTATMKANSDEIVSNKAKMKILQDQIGITGLTISQLQSKAIMLRNNLRNMVPGSADYKRYEAELQQVSARLSELRGKATQSKLSLGSMADGFNRYQAMALTVVASLTGVVLSIQKIIDLNGKLVGAQSNVMKTTGMTRQEVDELTKSFGLLHTRTSRIDLLGIAEQGGRIGIAKAEIGDFVNVMNKAAVSLGDSFTGGAEEVANKLGKIKFLFAETKDLGVEQTYNSIGSAINDLGANGVASEQNIADFTTRIGSLTDVLKPTIQETLALGAAFEESGIESEVSSRAYGIFMNRASTGAADFAKVMGISKKAVEDMINTNPLEFMLQFAEGMKGMNATDVAKTLDHLKINADGANKVIGAMGNNTARFRELIDLSNQSFADGTSLINEYNIKNNELEAILERIKKTVSGWFSSETFVKWLTVAVSWFANFIGATEEAENKISTWRITLAFTAKLLAVLVSSMISFTVASRVAAIEVKSLGVATAWANIQSKLNVMWLSLQKFGLIAYSIVMKIFSQEAKAATVAIRALNIAGAASPWGALLAVIAAVTTAYFVFRDSVNKATISQDSFSKQQKVLADEVGKSTAATKAHISALVSVINDENVSLATRKKAYENLVKIAPEFNGLLVKEGEKVSGLLTIYADYIKALDQVAYAKGFAKLNEKNIEKEISDAQKLYNAEIKMQQSKKAFDEYRSKTTIKNRDLYVDMDLSGKYSADKIAFEKAKSNLENTKKIVEQTSSFQTNTVNNLKKNITLREKQLSALETKYGKEVAAKSSGYKQIALKLKADKQSLDALIGSTGNNGETPDSKYKVPQETNGSGDKALKKQQETAKKQIEETEKFIEDKLKLERQAEDISLDKMGEGAAKEIIIEQVLLERKLEDLEKALKKEEDIKQAYANASNKNLSETERSYWKAQAELWEASNKTKSIEMEQAVYTHNLKLATIEEKAAIEAINKKKENFDREKQQREIKFNEELAALGNNKRAKRKL
ncbi:MAG: phage tail tape measure protein, partial [Flavobacteriales bacterium 32-34-25]